MSFPLYLTKIQPGEAGRVGNFPASRAPGAGSAGRKTRADIRMFGNAAPFGSLGRETTWSPLRWPKTDKYFIDSLKVRNPRLSPVIYSTYKTVATFLANDPQHPKQFFFPWCADKKTPLNLPANNKFNYRHS